jgi:hypothetical protein
MEEVKEKYEVHRKVTGRWQKIAQNYKPTRRAVKRKYMERRSKDNKKAGTDIKMHIP